MISIKKYKKLACLKNINANSFFFNKRILKFKKSKWKSIQKNILKTLKRKKKYRNLSVLQVKYGFWFKIKKSFKQGLLLKTFFNFNFGNKFQIKQLKTLIEKKNIISTIVVKPFFFLDVLLYKMNLFSSLRETRQFIFSKNLKVNNKRVNFSFTLKKGDIITFHKSKIPKTLFSTVFTLSFCEIDFYTNSIIILKNFKEISIKEIPLIYNDNTDFLLLSNYLYRT